MLNTDSMRDSLKNEIKIQKKLYHPHIIHLHHFFEDFDNIYLVLDYAENGNLCALLKRKKRLSEKDRYRLRFSARSSCAKDAHLSKKPSE